MGNSVCSCTDSQSQTDFNLVKLFLIRKSRKVNEDFNLPKKQITFGDNDKTKQSIINIKVERDDASKSKNSDKLLENENNIETRIYTDSISNGSNNKHKENNVKRIQNAFRNFKSKKLALEEKNKIKINLENNLNDRNIEERSYNYIRKSLKENNAFDLNNYASLDFLDKDDSKGNNL